jgi:hypothetical protein
VKQSGKEKSAAVFAVRRANYTHRRKGVFNVGKYSGFGSGWQCSLSHQEGALKKEKATLKSSSCAKIDSPSRISK